MRPHTRLVQGEVAPGDPYRPTSPPIYQTATFELESALGGGPYDYSRSGNPSRAAVERQLADLEGGGRAFAFASGMAALSAVLRLVPAGGHVVVGDDLYGGTWRLLYRVGAGLGIAVSQADATDPDAVRAAIRPETRLVLVETPSNPLLRVADVAALAAAVGPVPLAVDATACSPWLLRPLELGASVVVHSATKLLNGHSDVSAGVVATRDPALAERIGFVQNAEGAGLAPFDAFLLARGLRTLGVRLERQQAGAAQVAAWLAARDLPWVRYPGFGVLISFRTGSLARSAAVVDGLRRFATAVSFGSVHATVCLPCTMSHASIDPAARRLPDDLVRLSIGLEDPADLLEDLDAALQSGP